MNGKPDSESSFTFFDNQRSRISAFGFWVCIMAVSCSWSCHKAMAAKTSTSPALDRTVICTMLYAGTSLRSNQSLEVPQSFWRIFFKHDSFHAASSMTIMGYKQGIFGAFLEPGDASHDVVATTKAFAGMLLSSHVTEGSAAGRQQLLQVRSHK